MEKQKSAQKELIILQSILFIILLLGWLAATRLFQMANSVGFYFAAGMTMFLAVSLFPSTSESIRRKLLCLEPKDSTGPREFSASTSKKLTYVVAGLFILVVISFTVLPHYTSKQFWLSIIVGLFALRLLYPTFIKLVELKELSKAADRSIQPSPLKFSGMFLPTYTLNMTSSVCLFVGIYAVLVGKSSLYLVSGAVVATALFAMANKTIQQLATKVQPVGPHAFGSTP